MLNTITTCGKCGGSFFGFRCHCRVQGVAAAAAAYQQRMAEVEKMRERARQEENLRSHIIDGECERVDDIALPALREG